MEFWIKAGQLILSLSLLIVLHEFGHFIPARIFKTRVEKFFLFFDYKFAIFKKKIGETTWGLGWIPLGGYVKISGMIDESMDKEQMAKPAEPWEFRSKPAWQRLIIMIGGVVVNIIVGVLIYIFVLFTWGQEHVDSSKLTAGMQIHPYLEQYGFQQGDRVNEVDGEKLEHFNELNSLILLRGLRKVDVVHQDGSTETISLPDDIDYKMFKAGAFPAFGPRTKATRIETLAIGTDNDALEINEGDLLFSINNKTIDHVDISELKDLSDVPYSIIRGNDTLNRTIAGKDLDALMSSSNGIKSGLRPQDNILKIGEQSITYFDEIQSNLYKNKGKTVAVTVQREDSLVELSVPVTKEGTIGYRPFSAALEDKAAYHKVYYSFGESIGRGIKTGYWTLYDYGSQLKFIFTSKGASSMGGFGALGNLFSPEWDWQVFWERTALISIILAFMNILPIPALDGGHVIFLLYEMITGKEAPQKVLEYAQIIGFVLILSLVIYANGNDLFKFFSGS